MVTKTEPYWLRELLCADPYMIQPMQQNPMQRLQMLQGQMSWPDTPQQLEGTPIQPTATKPIAPDRCKNRVCNNGNYNQYNVHKTDATATRLMQ